MDKKSPEAFRTISEVAEWLGTPTHVLRFWESRFAQVRPVKRAGGRRYYRPADMMLLGGIKKLLHEDGMTIRGVQKLLREKGVKHVASLSPPLDAGFGEAIETGGETVVIEAPFAEVPEAEEVRGPAPVVDIGTARSEREGTAQRQEDTPEEPASAPYPFARPRVPFAEHSASRDSQTADTGQADVAKEPAGDGEPAPQPQAAEPDMSAESKAPQAKAAAGSGEGPAAAPTPDPMAFEAVMEALREGARPAPAAIAPILTRLETLRASFETPPAGSGDGPNG